MEETEETEGEKWWEKKVGVSAREQDGFDDLC